MAKTIVHTLYLSLLMLMGHQWCLAQLYCAPGLPKKYICRKISAPIHVDGKLDDQAWSKAQWTNDFEDIEGEAKPRPHYATKMKMLWDDHYLYIGVEMEEPHLWATYDQRDMIIFHENDFEVFIDPDGDTHNYYELEINALGTIWDLMLVKPYRDGGPPIDSWDIRDLKKGVHLKGTLNDPTDTDEGWSVELAIPFHAINGDNRHGQLPDMTGKFWRINCSRVQWQIESDKGNYQKKINPKTGKSHPEYNWVWSPQGEINMHQPEKWGYVYFADKHYQPGTFEKIIAQPEKMKAALREVYYVQKQHFEKHGVFSNDLKKLSLQTNEPIKLQATPSLFEATLKSGQTIWHINQEGKTWSTQNKNGK